MTKSEVFGQKVKPSNIGVSSGSKFIGAVFLYMLLALVITAVVAAGVGALLEYLLFHGQTMEFTAAYYFVLFSSLFLYIPSIIWVRIAAIRHSKSMIPAYVIYSITMGLVISSFTNFIPFIDIAIAFGGTCLTFAMMALIAWFSKKNLNTAGLIASGLMFGSLMLLAINLPLQFFAPQFFAPISWAISFILLIAVIIITAVDLRSVKKIAMNGGAESNVALLCALNLYVDFVYIFIKLLTLIGRYRK